MKREVGFSKGERGKFYRPGAKLILPEHSVAEGLMQRLRCRPFTPFRICAADGRRYDIHHPDQIIVLRGRVDIGVGSETGEGVADRVEQVMLCDVVRVEERIENSKKRKK